MESEEIDETTKSVTSGESVTFTVAGAREGFLECLPIAVGVASYGIVFGVLAVQAGLSVAEATLMSATVLAGAAQLIAVDLWADAAAVPVAAVLLTTVLVNLRYVLMGAALQPWFAKLSPPAAYGSIFFTADENWALTMGALTEDADGSRAIRGAYLLGSGFAIWLLWVVATIVGGVAGDGIGDPSQYGLDFVFAAVFVAIAVELWDGAGDLRPWAAAFAVALASASVLPGYWYVLLGACAGCVVGIAGGVDGGGPEGGDPDDDCADGGGTNE
ncbi:AzlC family ABC transporter permease [Natrarchaeobius sp. A-rgal3]|uniref:AzlC family ABC transporter permease n=1 Tax=Natrarchaeobius versutus TaxID=1679078 RepID=UPI00351067F7